MTSSHKNDNNKPSNNTRIATFIAIGIFIGAIITLIVLKLLPVQPLNNNLTGNTANSTSSSDESKPLYWVAPMDANYRRDQPGRSPMGMDLIPYYGSQNNSIDEGVGTIHISPSVINNLGVRTATATYSALNSTIKTVGYVSYDERKLVYINPRVTGWIEKLYINAIGEPVTKGQPLYDIYSPELVNAQEELLLALERKSKPLISAAENRLIALKIPQSAINTLKKAREIQRNVTFYAPQNGVIESLAVRVGLYVKPESNILSIVDLSQVWVKAEVFEHDIFKVAMGDSANMQLDYSPARQWRGSVEHIHPMLDPITRTGIVRLHFDNTDHKLRPNMFAQITIATDSNQEPVLQIPKEAVIRTGHQNRVVLALGDGYFKSVAVQIGRFDDHNIEILSGLSAGEKVVSSAQFLLDSESSKTSDFKRMAVEQTPKENAHASPQKNEVDSATVHGTVTAVMTDHRMVTIDREAIAKWDRAAASVDFIVSEAVDITLFTVDAYLMFTFEIHNGEFIIVNAMVMEQGMSHDSLHDDSHGTSHNANTDMSTNMNDDMSHNMHQGEK